MNRQQFTVISLAILLSVLTLGVLGREFAYYAVGSFYHPNSVAASYGGKYAWFFALVILINWIIALYVAFRKTASKKIWCLAAAFAILLVTFSSYAMLRRVHYDYRVEFYIEAQRYSIPWQYNPINGSKKPGGKYFVIHVSYPSLKGQYDNPEFHERELIISRHVLDEHPIGAPIDQLCERELPCAALPSPSNVYFNDGKFSYPIHYQGRPDIISRSGDELREFKTSIIRLFDSFESGT